MVIRNYHRVKSASRVLISTCSAPLVQTGERKQFSLFDLDLWPTTLTYNPRLAKIKVDPHAKTQGQRSNGSNRRVPTANGHTSTHTDATKRIISLLADMLLIEFWILNLVLNCCCYFAIFSCGSVFTAVCLSVCVCLSVYLTVFLFVWLVFGRITIKNMCKFPWNFE